MSEQYLEMYDEFACIISDNDTVTSNTLLEILKKYSSSISVFDMMDFTSQVIEENKYVQTNYRKNSEKSYIESFLMRIKDILKDNNDYSRIIDKKSFGDAINILKTHYETETQNRNTKVPLIFEIASLYATFILEESIHPAGTPFPGSLKVEKKNGQFLCPVKEANIDTSNAVCNICLQNSLTIKNS